jgi:hypothetical protein
MKKIIFILSLCACLSPAFAEKNIMFGEKINSITVYGAQSTGSGTLFKLVQPGLWDINPQSLLLVQYSQPMTLFRLDSRLNLNAVQNFGYNSSSGLSFFGMSISIDTAIFQYKDWYAGLGIGPYMRDRMDRWVESRLVFGEKVFIGKSINENWNIEIFTIHFSNGNFTEKNEGFNFAGIGFGYKF